MAFRYRPVFKLWSLVSIFVICLPVVSDLITSYMCQMNIHCATNVQQLLI
jgi:hypothetical protein